MTSDYTISYDLLEAFGVDRGTITCAACRQKVLPKPGQKLDAVVCQHCGHPHMYIRLKYRGSRLYIRADKHDRPHTYASAAEELITISRQISDRLFDPKERESGAVKRRQFENMLDAWMERKEKEEEADKIAPSTLGNYRTYHRLYWSLSEHLVGRDVRDIGLEQLQDFYDSVPGSVHYRKNIMDGLHAVFGWLLKKAEIGKMPEWPEIEQPMGSARIALTIEEQAAELARIPEEHRDIIEFAMEAGLRPAESCALMKMDINPARRAVLFRRTYSEGKLRRRTKNQRREYWLVVSDRAWELIERNMRPGDPERPFVFTNPATGRGYKYKFIYRVWKQYSATGADLSEATRHSFITQLVEDGTPKDQTMYVSRHVDERSIRPYYHPTDDRTRDVLNRRGSRKVISIGEHKKS